MLLRRLLQVAFALALVVVGASATLRLAANGIGCEPWPACYGRAATAEAANQTAAARALRLAHRIAASAFAVVALAVVAAGWRGWSRPARSAAVALIVVTVALAWIGRHTPSPLPAVTLVNLLGGFALLALLAFLLACRVDAGNGWAGTAAGAGLLALLAAVALQSAGGALISARSAGGDCASGCGALWSPGSAALAHPLVPGTAAELVGPRAGEVLHLLHRLAGLALMLVAIPAVRALAGGSARAVPVMFAAGATGGLGFVLASPQPSLPVAAAHALAAGLLCAALGAALGRRAESSRKP